MELLQRVPLPRRLSPRLWLISLPSTLVAFERRQRLPKLPIGRWRFLGIPLIAAGLGLWAWAWRRPEASPGLYRYTRWTRGPSITAGLLVLTGVAILVRSLLLVIYSLALALAARS